MRFHDSNSHDHAQGTHQNRRQRRAQERGQRHIPPPPHQNGPLLIPYTAEWFERLSRRKPAQAMQGAAVLAAAQRQGRCLDGRCCVVCGDEHAALYRPLDADTDPALLARLCAECVQIQGRLYGARFARVPEVQTDGAQ